MPKLRSEDTAALDIKTLEDAEYSEGQLDDYAGEVPPKNTRLHVFVKKMWWTETNPKAGQEYGDPMLKALIVADGNTLDETAEYEGLTIWENMALTAPAKFKWAPFLENFGLTIKDVKTKTFVIGDEDESNGAPIEKIGTWVVGSDDAYATILTARDKYEGEWRAHVGTWLPWEGEEELETAEDEAEAEEPEDEPEEEEEDEEPEEEDEEPEEEEEEEEQAASAPGRRASRSPAPARPARTPAPAKAPARGARTARSAPAKAAPAKAARGRATKAAKPAAAPARGRKARGSAADPPF